MPLLFRETMAQAAETVGADWSDVEPGGRRTLRRHVARDAVLIGALTLVLLLVALAARTHDSAPVTDAVPTAEDTSASSAEEVVRKKKQPAGKARKASKSAAPVPVSDGSGDLVVLSGQGSGGAGGTGGAPHRSRPARSGSTAARRTREAAASRSRSWPRP